MAYTKIPSKSQWLVDSKGSPGTRETDTVLKTIDGQLGAYEAASAEPNGPVVLCDLFFTSDYWLKLAGRGDKKVDSARKPQVQDLYECVVKQLCSLFNTTVNVLPKHLEQMFGREMSAAGIEVDIIGKADYQPKYLERTELPLYQLHFKDGVVQQYSWWTKPAGALVPAESKRAYVKGHVSDASEDYGFFVMSMESDIYMMRHGPTEDGRVFHSAYLAGGTTMAAGSMLIEGGRIKAIRSDSGHYKPTATNMVQLLRTLQMNAVYLGDIVMMDYDGKELGPATDFLDANAKWDAFLDNKTKTKADNLATHAKTGWATTPMAPRKEGVPDDHGYVPF